MRYKGAVDFHAYIKFSSRRDARRAFHELQGKYIYDNGCELELWPAQSRKLPVLEPMKLI